MSKRTPYELRKRILLILRDKPVSYTHIQTKLSTNYDSVKNNLDELQFYGLVKIRKVEKHPKNGKISFDAELTERGLEIARKVKSERNA